MGLSEQVILDNQQITSNLNDWGVLITMTATNGEIAIVSGLSRKHHLKLDETGNIVSTKQASVSVNEKALLTANPNYSLRITDSENPHFGEVNLNDHLIDAPDSTGEIKHYIARSWLPDEKLGMIVIILEDYAA